MIRILTFGRIYNIVFIGSHHTRLRIAKRVPVKRVFLQDESGGGITIQEVYLCQ
ncbi:hypothetical protein TTE1410 [Caldanaerobacter subterraneus subsp. tengcongensis MB4]|uniref:Uncharacterized protein n=1 Tax=Caldanaerobacter subterraneus subsp. tengcongensis (strain DSM 15242 / JCM 11007 / NBRC 100824 / MB4) TaxID=273068 RepID=Q8RA20_CALS4|nr:hypothetical protein TTE1410 [Caldanaerobacter subterraneus subsp. tengcongensis MB4]